MFVSLQGCVKVWDIRDQSPKTPVSQLDCLVRTLHIYMDLTTLVIYLLNFEASVRLCAPWSQKALTLYPATDCAAATDISGVSGRWQLSR